MRFKPSEVQLLDAYEYGYNFGCILQEKENPKKTGARTLVKCLVCGEIFDSSLDICPVCGVGRENFVPYEKEETSFRKDSDEFYVILGNGAAGLSAAKAIREPYRFRNYDFQRAVFHIQPSDAYKGSCCRTQSGGNCSGRRKLV